MSIAAKRLPQADHPKNPGKNCGRFDSAPSFCGGQAASKSQNRRNGQEPRPWQSCPISGFPTGRNLYAICLHGFRASYITLSPRMPIYQDAIVAHPRPGRRRCDTSTSARRRATSRSRSSAVRSHPAALQYVAERMHASLVRGHDVSTCRPCPIARIRPRASGLETRVPNHPLGLSWNRGRVCRLGVRPAPLERYRLPRRGRDRLLALLGG